MQIGTFFIAFSCFGIIFLLAFPEVFYSLVEVVANLFKKKK